MGNLTRTAIWVFIINIIAKLLGFAKETIIAYKFGTSYIVDTYTIAITFPSILFAIFASGIAEAYVPVVTRINGVRERNSLTNNIINITVIVSIVMTVGCLCGNSIIVRALAPGFDGETFIMAKEMVAIITPILPIMVIYNMINAHLTIHEEFIFINFINSLMLNVLIIISIVISSDKYPNMLVIGYVFSYVMVLMIYELYSYKKTSFRHKLCCNYKSNEFKDLISLAIPLGVSLILNQINSMVDRAFASGLGEGIIASLGYANKIQLLFYSLITSVIISVSYPRINKCFADQKLEQGMYYVKKAFLIASYIGIPIMMIIIVYSQQVTMVIFERGAFSAESTKTTAECLTFYTLGLLFYSYREILLKTLAACKKQKLIMKNTAVSIIFNICFNIIMVNHLKHIGLALATSLAGIIAVLLIYRDIKRIGLVLIKREDKKELLLILVATILSVFISKGCFTLMISQLNEVISFFCSIGIGTVSYLVMSYIFDIHIFKWMLFSMLKKQGEK